MKKLLVSLIMFTACGDSQNRAVVMVQSQAPKATCISTKLGTLEIAKCDVPGKDKVTPFLAVYDTALTQAFQVYPLEQEKKEAPAPTPPPGEGSGAAAPAPQ